jgi:hypothetical protein
LLFAGGRPKRRIGLDERLRRHHAALRRRRVLMTVLLGAAIIAFSLVLGRISSGYNPLPSLPKNSLATRSQ